MKIRTVEAKSSHADGRIDRHDEANSRFSHFCEARKEPVRADTCDKVGIALNSPINTFYIPLTVGFYNVFHFGTQICDVKRHKVPAASDL
jgi:hypothetical protein